MKRVSSILIAVTLALVSTVSFAGGVPSSYAPSGHQHHPRHQGGHSQGGFLTYSLLMNSPTLIAGAFPISCGVIFQCEPEAYSDEPLRKAQRSVPLAIVHGRNDPLVDFDGGRYAATLFGESGWPALHFFTSDTAGHMFARLPVGEAIRWLESLASDDPDVLLGFAA